MEYRMLTAEELQSHITLWSVADKLRADRSTVSSAYQLFRPGQPFLYDDYYQPHMPATEELDFVRFAQKERVVGFYGAYDLSEPEVEEAVKTRDELIQEGFQTYTGKRLKHSGAPWLRPLSAHVGFRVTSRERRDNWRLWRNM